MTKPINPIPAVALDILTRRFVAAEADVADPTLARALAGQRVKQSSLRRIRVALAARALLAALPPNPCEGE